MKHFRFRFSILSLMLLTLMIAVSVMFLQRYLDWKRAETEFQVILENNSPLPEQKEMALLWVKRYPALARKSGTMPWASRHADTELCRSFLEAGANPNERDSERNEPPLSWAIRRQESEIALLLLQYGAVPTLPLKWGAHGETGETLVHLAVWRRDLEVTRGLIEAGADVNAVDIFEESPLHVAVQRHHPEMVQMLLELGARNHPNREGVTPYELSLKLRGKREAKENSRHPLDQIVHLLEKQTVP